MGHLSVTATGIKDSRLTQYHGWENRFFSSDRVNVSSVNGSNAQRGGEGRGGEGRGGEPLPTS